MKAVELLRTRIAYTEIAFAELVLWQVPAPVKGSTHRFKYSLAYIVNNECVLRYDNEAGKGDHRHYAGREGKYAFTTSDQLISDFQRDIKRWNDENRNT